MDQTSRIPGDIQVARGSGPECRDDSHTNLGSTQLLTPSAAKGQTHTPPCLAWATAQLCQQETWPGQGFFLPV